MTTRHIESGDGVGKFLSDQDKTRAGLARIFVETARTWRENYGEIPLPSISTPVEAPAQIAPTEDISVIFGCSEDQIATSPDQINDNTKAYVGSLVHYDNNGKIIPIFKKIGHLEHIYTQYPERRVRGETISIGGKTSKELQEELKKRKVNVSSYAEEDMMKSKDFTTLKKPENISLMRLKIQDLELEGTPTTDEVYARIQALGGELCPSEVGPHYRLVYDNQPMNERLYIAMKQISARRGHLNVFRLGRREDGLWLGVSWARPPREWSPSHGVVFSLSPPAGEASKVEPKKPGFLDRFLKR